MKTITLAIIAVIVITFASCRVAHAQTNTNAPVSILTPAGNTILSLFIDQTNFYGTNGVRADVFGLYTGGTKGAAFDMHLPLLTNGQISAGVAVADIGNQLYDAALNINLSTTVHPLRIIGMTTNNFAVQLWVESGPDALVKSGSIGSQTFGGLSYNTHLGSGCLSVSALGGNISQLPKKVWGFGLGYTIHPFPGW